MGSVFSQSITSTNNPSHNNFSISSYIAKDLPNFIVENAFPPGSGRFFRSFRIRSQAVNSPFENGRDNSATTHLGSPLLVCKVMLARYAESNAEKIHTELTQKAKELQKLKQLLQNAPNILTYQEWHLSASTDHDHRSNTICQPIYLFRQHMYSTLSDRMNMRPFLSSIEKIWIIYQMLKALTFLHSRNIFHGNITAENICLTSWGWLCIVDVGGSARMKPVRMRDYDPSDFIYFYQKGEGPGVQSSSSSSTNYMSETQSADRCVKKGCYLAPERFYDKGELEKEDGADFEGLTSKMDIFSAGCVIIEMYLNGEKALDLGDLMEYRAKNTLVPSLKQKLKNIESSSIRAACKHMLSLDPSMRLSANDYIEKLSSGQNGVIPNCFEQFLWPFFCQFQSTNNYGDGKCYWSHDARVAILAQEYSKGALRCMMENVDHERERYFRHVLGPTANGEQKVKTSAILLHESKTEDVLAETESLLAKLTLMAEESIQISPTNTNISDYNGISSEHNVTDGREENDTLSSNCKACIIIILQFLLSSVRHVHKPSTKIISLQLIRSLHRYVDDEIRLQRIVPNLIGLVDDSFTSVKGLALEVLVEVLECIDEFPPSDSQLFPKYILKRIHHLSAVDEDESVKAKFAACLGRLALTCKRFLDLGHAMRLQDALDGESAVKLAGYNGKRSDESSLKSTDENRSQRPPAFSDFPDDVANLLGAPKESSDRPDLKRGDITQKPGYLITQTKKISMKKEPSNRNATNTTLIPNTYDDDFLELQECVMGLVTQLTNPTSSFVKRALLYCSLAQLASFFEEYGTTTKLLPTILTFWNDIRNWDIRAMLCESLPQICPLLGRLGTEEFVVPCIEVACLDEDEVVVCSGLRCLRMLIDEGLIRSRGLLIGDIPNVTYSKDRRIGILEKYVSLIFHPSESIRFAVLSLISAWCRTLGFPDDEVFVLPILRPFLKYEVTTEQLQSAEKLKQSVLPPVSRLALLKCKQNEAVQKHERVAIRNEGEKEESLVETVEVQGNELFQSININDNTSGNGASMMLPKIPHSMSRESRSIVNDEEARLGRMETYINLIRKRHHSYPKWIEENDKIEAGTQHDINLSEYFSISFPNQKFVELISKTLPDWYNDIRSISQSDGNLSSECTLLKSLNALVQVYGLSLTLPSNKTGTSTSDLLQDNDIFNEEMSSENMKSCLSQVEARLFEASELGEIGATAFLDPSLGDLSIIGNKLHCLNIPPLPPKLGVLHEINGRAFSWHGPILSTSESTAEALMGGEWKPKIDSLIISSTENSKEHMGAVSRLAVSQDQTFFVSASHDGTSRVWDLRQTVDAIDLRSSFTYFGHCSENCANSEVRLNDVCMIENSHSVVTAGSDGSVHIWRVDMTSEGQISLKDNSRTPERLNMFDKSRVSGASLIREVNPQEGEILSVSHFNTNSSSLVLFASQNLIHSWDLRCAKEPFSLPLKPELGFVTDMATGTDRNWMVNGTSRGYLALWDLRFQAKVKLWHHNSGAPITRLATCFTTLPQDQGKKTDDKPYVFMGCGQHEALVFDVSAGLCRQSFRVLDPSLYYVEQAYLPKTCLLMPTFDEIALPSNPNGRILSGISSSSEFIQNRKLPPKQSIVSIMGRIGKRGQSYLMTGGSDRFIRYWDFTSISKCYTVCGTRHGQSTPIFNCVETEESTNSSCKLFLCRQSPIQFQGDVEKSKMPRQLHKGPQRPDNSHKDAVLDLKSVDLPVKGLLSCSRDGVIKVWR